MFGIGQWMKAFTEIFFFFYFTLFFLKKSTNISKFDDECSFNLPVCDLTRDGKYISDLRLWFKSFQTHHHQNLSDDPLDRYTWISREWCWNSCCMSRDWTNSYLMRLGWDWWSRVCRMWSGLHYYKNNNHNRKMALWSPLKIYIPVRGR